jgi:hypothetical protein
MGHYGEDVSGTKTDYAEVIIVNLKIDENIIA